MWELEDEIEIIKNGVVKEKKYFTFIQLIEAKRLDYGQRKEEDKIDRGSELIVETEDKVDGGSELIGERVFERNSLILLKNKWILIEN